MPDLGISLELVGHGKSFAAADLWFSVAITYVQFDRLKLGGLTVMAIITVVSFGTVAYTYSRWRTTHNPATLALNLYFLTASPSHLGIALFEAGVEVNLGAVYLAVGLHLISMMFLNLGALLALDWKQLTLLPVMIVLPALVLLFISFPTPSACIPVFNRVEAITHMFQMVLPVALYLLLWDRMRPTGSPRRMRALMMAVGIVVLLGLYVVVSVLAVTLEVRGVVLMVAYVIMWLGLTGRADRFAK
ncbi:MAG: hypothetical protein ACTSPE_03900 [Candidatus Thorarchaeota archaeon]